MKITNVIRTPRRLRVMATFEGGAELELASFQSGPFEVYDRPYGTRRTPRFCGYMPEETLCKLRAVLRRMEGEDDRRAERAVDYWLWRVREMPKRIGGRVERPDVEYFTTAA